MADDEDVALEWCQYCSRHVNPAELVPSEWGLLHHRATDPPSLWHDLDSQIFAQREDRSFELPRIRIDNSNLMALTFEGEIDLTNLDPVGKPEDKQE